MSVPARAPMMTERVEIEGGGVSVAVPAAMLDPRVPMSSVLSTRTWMDELTMDERASLRRFLPNPTASEEDVSALLTTLFGDVMNGDGDGDVNGGSNMHFGNPAQRLWREIQARERDPEVMAHRVAIARVEEGAHELEVRLHHARVARAGMGMLRKFRDAADAKQAHAGDDDEAVDVTREDRHRAWRERSATPEPDRPPEDSDDDLGDDLASPSKAERDELAASEEAVRLAVAVAKEAAEAAASLGTGTGAMAALRAAERAMAAAESAKEEHHRVKSRVEAKRYGVGLAGGGGGPSKATKTSKTSTPGKPKVPNPVGMRVEGPEGLNRRWSTNEDF